jgi:hypothetical protein
MKLPCRRGLDPVKMRKPFFHRQRVIPSDQINLYVPVLRTNEKSIPNHPFRTTWIYPVKVMKKNDSSQKRMRLRRVVFFFHDSIQGHDLLNMAVKELAVVVEDRIPEAFQFL